MSKHQSVAKEFSSGLLRAAVVSGLASGLAAAALGGVVPKANATCIGFSGISIGVGCTTQLGTIAAVLGPGTATARGFFTGAIAIGDALPLRMASPPPPGQVVRVRMRPRTAPSAGPSRKVGGNVAQATGGLTHHTLGLPELCLQPLWRGQLPPRQRASYGTGPQTSAAPATWSAHKAACGTPPPIFWVTATPSRPRTAT